MGVSDYIDLAVMWAPSIIFVLIIGVSTLIGMVRGYRKSLILFIQSIIAFSLCLIIYLCLVNIEAVDKFLLIFANKICILFTHNDLPTLLGISSTGSHLKEVITDFIIMRMDFGEMINIMLSENTGYIYALINFVYHIAFAIFMWFVYEIMLFIFYIINIIFFSTRKYKNKINEKFSTNLADGSYRKKPGKGALIGCIRGTISAIISLSFLGSALYMVAGKGEGTVSDYDFGDETINEVFTMYRSFDKYGTTGIYKVLNAIDNDDDVPLYLFAADLVLQGSYVEIDSETGEENKIQLSLRSELGVYTEFAREAGNLFLKFGGDRIRSLILGESDEDAFYLIMDIFSEPEFQADFQIAIDKIYDSRYINKLAFSLIDSYLANIDNMGVEVPLEVGEMARIIFKKGYYSSLIPEEKALSKSGKILPYISSSDIVLRSDLSTILRAFYVLVDESILEGEEFDPAILVRELLPYIRSLSLFDIKEDNPINPVLGRVFMLCENTYLKEINLGNDTENKKYLTKEETDAYQTLINNYKIDYVREINALLDSADAITEMYNNVYDPEKEVLDIILSIFDEDGKYYDRNIELFDELLDTLTSSQLLGKVLGSAGIVGIIEDAFTEISPNIKLPSKINFANTYDDDGKLIEYGELYNILCGLKELGKKENKEFINNLIQGSDSFSLESLQTLAGSINKVNERGETLCDYLSSSVILNSFISNLIYENNGLEGTFIYIPQVALEEENGEKIILIKKQYFADILSNLETIFEVIEPLIENPDDIDNVYKIINNPNILSLLDNPIVQATFANQIIVNEDQIDFFIISQRLHDVEEWVSQDDNESGELINLIVSIFKLDIDFTDFSNFNPIDCIQKLTHDEIQSLFNSEVLLYSISNFILNNDIEDFTIISPKESLIELKNEKIDYLVYPKELISLFDNLKIVDSDDTNQLLVNVIREKDNVISSSITSATLSYYIYSYLIEDAEIKDMLPDSLLTDGEYLKTKVKTLDSKYKDNLWSSEFEKLLYALDEIYNVSINDNASIDFDKLEDNILDIINNRYDDPSLKNSNTKKLEVVYDSLIIKNSITKSLDEALIDNYTYENGYVSDIITDSKKDGFYKYQEIYSICDIINCLGIEGGIENLNDFDFENVKITEANKERIIKNIKSSLIIRGTLSGAIYTACLDPVNGAILKDHPLCYESDIDRNSGIEFDSRFAIFNSSELEALINIITGYKFSEMEITLDLINRSLPYIKNDLDKCESYILVATISYYVFDYNLSVPENVIEEVSKQKFIDNIELYYLVYSLNGITGLDLFNEDEVSGDTTISLDITFVKNNIDVIVKSKILSVFVAENIKINNSDMFVEKQVASIYKNYDGTKDIVLMSEDEFLCLLRAFIVLSPNGDLSFTFDMNNLVGLSNNSDLIEIIISSSVITVFLYDNILKPYSTVITTMLGCNTISCDCYKLNDGSSSVSKEIYNYNDMMLIISYLPNIIYAS